MDKLNKIDFEYYEGDNDIIYRDLDIHIAICSSPCFIPKTDYKYFTVWRHWMEHEVADVIRIDMREPKYITGKLSDDEIKLILDLFNKTSFQYEWMINPNEYKDYIRDHVHTVWEDLNYFNDHERNKKIDILPIPDYTKLNR